LKIPIKRRPNERIIEKATGRSYPSYTITTIWEPETKHGYAKAHFIVGMAQRKWELGAIAFPQRS